MKYYFTAEEIYPELVPCDEKNVSVEFECELTEEEYNAFVEARKVYTTYHAMIFQRGKWI